MKKIAIIIILLLLTCLTSDLYATSLWNKAGKGKQVGLYKAQKAVWNKHDLVTIKIIEQTSATHDSKTASEKESTMSGAITSWFRWSFGDKKPDQLTTMPKLGYTGSKTHEADASIENGGSFVGVITAEVAEVLPNGNLVLEAVKNVRIHGDIQTLKLTGIAAQRDIDTVDRTIVSAKIANANIEYVGKGIVSDAQKQGILSRIFDKIWMF